MPTITLEAQSRSDYGKGASRRLRREHNAVPIIIYGGDKKPESAQMPQNKLAKALENERIYASVFDIRIDNHKVEHVILKAIQRHPYKTQIMHIDLQRVSPKDVLVKSVPLHFLNEEHSNGVIMGGVVNHVMTQLEVRCKASDLPAFIEVDLSGLELDQVLHLSDIKLPAKVQLATPITDDAHNSAVVGIHLPKKPELDEPVVEEEEVAEGDAGAENAAAATDTSVKEDSNKHHE
ncbi:MAG: 50S ribosomal protein L25/general stress protein Ctc [Legionellaceae bacterium]|nr:50S ribosomal protein L25/general stress protein Ctc [Legionellaceae bacterium]